MMGFPFFLAALSGLIFVLLAKLGGTYFKLQDIPDGELKPHQKAVPLTGGIGIALAFYAAILILAVNSFFLNSLYALGLFVILGLWDDLRTLKPAFRLLAEILFSDFVTCAMDPIVNQAAKLRYMSGGQYRIPLVVRLPSGVGLAVAAQHSQSLEAMLMNIPGLIVAAPGRARDARAMLKTAIRSENPVIFFEHKLCYLTEGEVPEAEEWIPFGKANVVRTGADVTVVCLLYTVHQALEAADELAREGIDAEVVDLRTLAPLDTDTVLESVGKTGRLITVEEGPIRGGWGAEVVARVASAGVGPFLKPPVRLGAGDHPIPYNRTLENLSVPDTGRIAEAVRRLLIT